MRSRMPPEYQVPDDPDTGKMDASYLRTCLGIRTPIGEPPPPLPVAVRRAHYDMARSLSLLGSMGPNGMSATQLAIVVMLALRDENMEAHSLPVEKLPVKVTFTPGQKVVVYWRNKDMPGHFIQVEDDRIVVLLAGSERRFRPDLVRAPEEDEFPEVAANINSTVEAA